MSGRVAHGLRRAFGEQLTLKSNHYPSRHMALASPFERTNPEDHNQYQPSQQGQDRRGHLYVVQLREHINAREEVFKVGRAKCLVSRISQYPPESALILSLQVPDRVAYEVAMLEALRAAPEMCARTDLGSEYFQGQMQLVCHIVMNTISERGLTFVEQPPVPFRRARGAVKDDYDDAQVVSRKETMRFSEILSSLMDEKGPEWQGRVVPVGQALAEVQAHMEAKRWACKNVTRENLGAKLTRYYGCRHVPGGTELLLAYPGRRQKEVREDEKPIKNHLELLDDFMREKCRLGDGMRAPTADVLAEYRHWSGDDTNVNDRSLPALLRAKGITKKIMRVGRKTMSCYVGMELNRDL